MGLDTTAWFVPEGDILDVWNSADPSAGPFGGCSASQLSISGSNLVNTCIYSASNFTFPGGFGQGGPITVPLKSGTIMWNNMQMLYGTVAARIRFPGNGTHAALWMMGAPSRQTCWQQNPNVTTGLFQNNSAWVNEIDIAETIPFLDGPGFTNVRQNLFDNTQSTVQHTTVTDYTLNFHEYKVSWTPSAITWFVDGVQTNQLTAGLPNGPMYVIIDIETDQPGIGSVTPANYPTTMLVDYVKAWDQSGTLFFSDDFTGARAFQRFDLND